MKTVCTLITLFIVTFCSAQEYAGRVLDIKNQPVAYANIVAYTTDSTYIDGTTSDDDGRYTLSLDKEVGFFEVSFIGYESQTITPTSTDLGTIILTEGTQLQEVVITGRRPTIVQKVDRLVFGIENTIAGSGGDALDVLRVTPSVLIEDDNLNIVGKGAVRVMVNGRIVQLSGEQLMSYLSGIASDDIKKIEVITSPPSKYEAEGNAGLINIVLKKAKADSWNNQIRTSYTRGIYDIGTLGNTFSYNQGKWSVLASLSGRKGHRGSENELVIEYPEATWKTPFNLKEKMDMASGRVGVDYAISDRSSVGFTYEGSYQDGDIHDQGTATIEDGKGSYIKNEGVADLDDTNHAINAHYVQKLDTLGRSLSVDLDFFDVSIPVNRVFSSQRYVTKESFTKANNISNQNIRNYSAKIDFEHPTSWAKYSYGGKISQTRTMSDVVFYNLSTGRPILDKNQSNEFEYNEGVQALYADASKPFGKYWQTKVGLRAEYTRIKGVSKTLDKTHKDNYLKLFPTVYVSYAPSGTNQFSGSYNRRIQRPYFQNLNPFRFYINGTSYQEGNPFLSPQITDNVELQHVHKGMFITKLFGSYVSNGYNNVIKVDDSEKKIVVTYDNFFTAYNYGVSETVMYNPTDWWRTMSQVSVSKMDARFKKGYDIGAKLVSGWNAQVFSKHTFTLRKKNNIQAEATFLYASPQKMMYFKTSSIAGLDLGLKFSLLENKLNCTISANDVFRSKTPTVYFNTNGIAQNNINYRDSQNIKVSLSYRFGNDKIRVNTRTAGNKDIQNRS